MDRNETNKSFNTCIRNLEPRLKKYQVIPGCLLIAEELDRWIWDNACTVSTVPFE